MNPPRLHEKVCIATGGEIANVHCFLASGEASCVNGAVLEVSGGMTV